MSQANSINKLPVTIVTANYNNGRYLCEYFDSIFSSTVAPESIIIVDDGSTDDSLTILDSYADKMPNLLVVKFFRNQGFANALNAGMKLVTTEFVIRLDPDDWMEPTRIASQVNFLQKNTEIGVVGSNVYYVSDSNRNVAGKSNFKSDHNWVAEKYREGEYGVMHGAICAKSELFKIYKYNQEYVPAEDYDIFARMIADGIRFHNLQNLLSCIRVHNNSISNSLNYLTVERIFNLRHKIFDLHCSKLVVRFAFISRKHYRIALFSDRHFTKYGHLLIAGVFNPKAVLRRLYLA